MTTTKYELDVMDRFNDWHIVNAVHLELFK